MKQKTVHTCSSLLCAGAFLSIGLVVLIAFFTNKVGEDETFNLLIGSAFQQAALTSGDDIDQNVQDFKPVVVLGGIMIGITMFGIVCACCSKITMHRYFVGTTMFTLLSLSVILTIFGGILIAPRYAGTDYIKRNCMLAFAGEFDQIDQYSRYVFEPIVEFDKQYQNGVNSQMCTEFCVCPYSNENDKHYQDYSLVPADTYQQFNRSFLPTLEQMVQQIYYSVLQSTNITDPENPLIFQILPDGSTDQVKRSFSESILECYSNAEYISEALGQKTGNQTAVGEKMYELKQSKPNRLFIDVVTHIEQKYSCSGLCQAPLFFFTQSIKKGPPQTACLQPLINDAAILLQNLGAAMMGSGIMFFFMFLCSFPICFYDAEKEREELLGDDEEEEYDMDDSQNDRKKLYQL